jgi:hypothetical protein
VYEGLPQKNVQKRKNAPDTFAHLSQLDQQCHWCVQASPNLQFLSPLHAGVQPRVGAFFKVLEVLRHTRTSIAQIRGYPSFAHLQWAGEQHPGVFLAASLPLQGTEGKACIICQNHKQQVAHAV